MGPLLRQLLPPPLLLLLLLLPELPLLGRLPVAAGSSGMVVLQAKRVTVRSSFVVASSLRGEGSRGRGAVLVLPTAAMAADRESTKQSRPQCLAGISNRTVRHSTQEGRECPSKESKYVRFERTMHKYSGVQK
jgi:hypothetical protein